MDNSYDVDADPFANFHDDDYPPRDPVKRSRLGVLVDNLSSIVVAGLAGVLIFIIPAALTFIGIYWLYSFLFQ